MTKWFIEAPNSILDTEKAFLEKRDLAVAVRLKETQQSQSAFTAWKKTRDTPSFVIEFISILIFDINYQVLTYGA